jgi:hypothetical protein
MVALLEATAMHHLYLARITGVEVIAAMCRRARLGDIVATDVAAALSQFRQDFAKLYRILEITPAAEELQVFGTDRSPTLDGMATSPGCARLGTRRDGSPRVRGVSSWHAGEEGVIRQLTARGNVPWRSGLA